MKRYLLNRVLQAIGVIFAISLITFFVLRVVSGNPAALMLGEYADADTIARVSHEMGLDKPIVVQYVDWLTGMLRGDFGTSYYNGRPVLDILFSSFTVTAKLAGIAYVLAVVMGVVLGVIASVNRGTWLDSTLMTISVFGISAPAFWMAIILQIFLGLQLKLLPLSGIDSPACFIMPGVALGLRYAASIARITRTSMLEVLSQDYIRTARAKGLKNWVIIIKHALRNALIPIITIAGSDLGNILTGSVLVESVFAIPGLGKMLVDSINKRDLPIIQGGVIYIAFICVVMYLVVDLLYAVVDPRIRLGKESD